MSAGNKRIRIVLADDHPVVRAGIRAALEMIKAKQPDVVFMDISMPGLNGLETTARIHKEFPGVRVIILSRHENEEYYWQALRAGACGYLLKKAAIAELGTALQRVAGGEIYLSRDISARLLKKFPLHQIAHFKSPLEQLTARQREILQLIAEGQTTKAIALILKVSPKTVEYHRSKLMERLNLHDIPGLVRFALRSGLVTQEV